MSGCNERMCYTKWQSIVQEHNKSIIFYVNAMYQGVAGEGRARPGR
jgi:hypothetical protein